ncbi:ECF transporter S component [Pseudalkalibacillus berkeleyi]|uniref:Riboflavin transporter n=1 Tax=Pseudalkalibacillus berkeleyi TaxID=1069813 RepID=A0ABS9GXN5_9BACL|nr:ECF transporter S component [Pseudalkalibacillus berkeleyi]MCF6136370.1 ECF transporter S component [Pseudalkalibacillus berkeleyi]
MQPKGKLYRMIAVSLMSSIAYVLMLLDFPFPGLPPFLKIDLSDVPALLSGIVFGPVAGITVEAIKNILHYGVQGSMTGVPVGQFANFIAGSLFIVPAAILFRKYRSKKGLTLGLLTGALTMTLMMALLNYVLILPAYTWFLNYDPMTSEMMTQLIITGITPFNLIKSTIVAGLFIMIYYKLSPYLNRMEQRSS